MGAKSKQKDRSYLTNKEWKEEWGGAKVGGAAGLPFSQLPFYCCALTFTPFEDPVCTSDGSVFEIVHIVPYIQKFKKHPVTGEALALGDLFKLNFHKNADGEYACPVLNKVFNEFSHIVANKKTGNVFCFEAVDELNIKPKNWRDLLTEEPFTRADLVTLQDPRNVAQRDLSGFDHVKKELKVVDDDDMRAKMKDPSFNLNMDKLSGGLKKTLDALQRGEGSEAFVKGGGGKRAEALRLVAEARAMGGAPVAPAPTSGPDPRLVAPKRTDVQVAFRPGTATWNADAPSKEEQAKGKRGRTAADACLERAKQLLKERSNFVQSNVTGGRVARAFTSSVMPSHTTSDLTEQRVQRRPKKKAYVRISTTLGDLNCELHADMVPRTVENFLLLAESGYYAHTGFHRSIKNFMIQGGDPTGTGTGGESVFGPTFPDELDSRLTHKERGVLAMANSGKDTNGSQFFILYKSAHHLDNKHSVFGKVVGGLDVLSAMERVPTDSDDRPLQEIRITGVAVFVNPFTEEHEAERKAQEAKAAKEAQEERDRVEVGTWFSNPAGAQQTINAAATGGAGGGGVGAAPQPQPQRSGVGKYLQLPKSGAAAAAAGLGEMPPPAKKPKTGGGGGGGFGNFDSW